MNSNANTVELKRDLNICLADGRQPTTADGEKCAYTGWILLQSIHIQKELHETSSVPALSLQLV